MANTCYPSMARNLEISHEANTLTFGECIQGDLHIQMVNSRHNKLK